MAKKKLCITGKLAQFFFITMNEIQIKKISFRFRFFVAEFF
jgi:hypothetical protein